VLIVGPHNSLHGVNNRRAIIR